MSNEIKFRELTLEYKAIGALLKSDLLKEVCVHEAEKKAGSNGHVKSFVGFDRVHAIAYPNTKKHPR